MNHWTVTPEQEPKVPSMSELIAKSMLRESLSVIDCINKRHERDKAILLNTEGWTSGIPKNKPRYNIDLIEPIVNIVSRCD